MVTIADDTPETATPKRLYFILAAGLVIRLVIGLAVAGAPPQIVDAVDYDELAVRLAEHNAFAAADGTLISLRPPFYPFWVSLAYRIVGPQQYAFVYALQSAVGLLTTWLVYRLAATVYDTNVGVAAAGLYCFYPTLLAYEQLLLTETIATCLLAGATLCTVQAAGRESWPRLVAAGLLYGLAALTRSATLLFVPFLGAWLLFAWPQSLGRRLAAAATVVVVFAAAISPWAVRNTRVQRTVTMIDVMGGRNAMMGNYEFTPLERSWAAIDLAQGEEAWYRVLRRAYPEEYRTPRTQGQIDKLAMRYALRYMIEHPRQTVERSLVKCFNFWQLEREIVAGAARGNFGDISRPAVAGLAIVVCGYYAACVFAAVFGAFLAPIPRRSFQALFLLSIAVPWAAHSLIFAHSRYHLPLVPLLCTYAAAALIRRREILTRHKTIPFVAACLCCSILIAGWLREFTVVDQQHFSRAVVHSMSNEVDAGCIAMLSRSIRLSAYVLQRLT